MDLDRRSSATVRDALARLLVALAERLRAWAHRVHSKGVAAPSLPDAWTPAPVAGAPIPPPDHWARLVRGASAAGHAGGSNAGLAPGVPAPVARRADPASATEPQRREPSAAHTPVSPVRQPAAGPQHQRRIVVAPSPDHVAPHPGKSPEPPRATPRTARTVSFPFVATTAPVVVEVEPAGAPVSGDPWPELPPRPAPEPVDVLSSAERQRRLDREQQER